MFQRTSWLTARSLFLWFRQFIGCGALRPKTRSTEPWLKVILLSGLSNNTR
jgi:hypothetical protein